MSWRQADCKALYIVKPEAFDRRDAIRDRLVAHGLEIESAIEMMLRAQDIEMLYALDARASLESAEMRRAHLKHFERRTVEVGVVRGTDAWQRLLALCGHATNPAECAEGTLRRDFGGPGRVSCGVWYYDSAVHRATTVEEARGGVAFYCRDLLPAVLRPAVAAYVRARCDSESRLKRHVMPVVECAVRLAEASGCDSLVVELGAWLHDISRMQGGDRVIHHVESAAEAARVLRSLGAPRALIDAVAYCILTHSGNWPYERTTPESRVVCSADGIVHLRTADLYMPIAMTRHGMSAGCATEWAKRKLEESWTKIAVEFRDNVAAEYGAARQLVEESWRGNVPS